MRYAEGQATTITAAIATRRSEFLGGYRPRTSSTLVQVGSKDKHASVNRRLRLALIPWRANAFPHRKMSRPDLPLHSHPPVDYRGLQQSCAYADARAYPFVRTLIAGKSAGLRTAKEARDECGVHCANDGRRYSTLAPVSLTSFAQRAMSSLTKAPNSSGELPIGSKPKSPMRLRTSGSFMAVMKSE